MCTVLSKHILEKDGAGRAIVPFDECWHLSLWLFAKSNNQYKLALLGPRGEIHEESHHRHNLICR